MGSAGSLATFVVAAAIFVAVPGPSVLFVISRAVALGRRAALLTVVGNASGVFLQALLVAAGAGAVVERSIVAFTVLKLAGAAYLGWLGFQAIRHRGRLAAVLDATDVVQSRRSLLVDGFVVGVANPKAIVFFAAILPQFVQAGGPASPWCPTAAGPSWPAPPGSGSPAHPGASSGWEGRAAWS
jgi:threonine/homoserine/homoserine lactone efflux protein